MDRQRIGSEAASVSSSGAVSFSLEGKGRAWSDSDSNLARDNGADTGSGVFAGSDVMFGANGNFTQSLTFSVANSDRSSPTGRVKGKGCLVKPVVSKSKKSSGFADELASIGQNRTFQTERHAAWVLPEESKVDWGVIEAAIVHNFKPQQNKWESAHTRITVAQSMFNRVLADNAPPPTCFVWLARQLVFTIWTWGKTSHARSGCCGGGWRW